MASTPVAASAHAQSRDLQTRIQTGASTYYRPCYLGPRFSFTSGIFRVYLIGLSAVLPPLYRLSTIGVYMVLTSGKTGNAPNAKLLNPQVITKCQMLM